METFLLKLLGSQEGVHHVVAYQLLRWSADIIDSHPCWEDWETDGLQLDLGKASKKMRPVHPSFVRAVQEKAMEGSLGKSGQQIGKNVLAFRRLAVKFKPKSFNKWADPYVQQSLLARMDLLRSYWWSMISVSCDATRLGGLDVLWLAVQFPELNLADWSPPQAPTSNYEVCVLNVSICHFEILVWSG